ncbi:hypothetical protein [Streptomyces sp. NPDC021622]|uniref:hypothetical protein n=1 Tax=Streptomyces sp. NPDC021622 TaxID=3155013 RepID=UPI0033E42A12
MTTRKADADHSNSVAGHSTSVTGHSNPVAGHSTPVAGHSTSVAGHPQETPPTPLTPYAHLPRRYHDRHIAHSTVDAFGSAHWLLAAREPKPGRGALRPYDALVVTVDAEGRNHTTELSALRARFPRIDALPDGGFVVADARSRRSEQHVQVYDALGRESWTFRVGDAIEQFLVDPAGRLWVGHFDEGVFGDDELSGPGLRCWSAEGEPLWAYEAVEGAGEIYDCYALNVSGDGVWACAYDDFALLEIDPDRMDGTDGTHGSDRTVRPRLNSVAGAHALAVWAGRAMFVGGYGDDRDRLVDAVVTHDRVRPVSTGRLVRPDGTPLGRRRTVSRGRRVYVQEEPHSAWAVLDIGV